MIKTALAGCLIAGGVMAGVSSSFAQTVSFSTTPVAEMVSTLKNEGRLSMSWALFGS